MDLQQHIHDVFRATQILTREDLRCERAVQNTKWFDYRFIAAVDATRLFADAYLTAFQAKWRKYRDRDEGDRKRPLKPLFTDRSEFTSLWRARLIADGLGIPYQFFINQAIEATVGRKCRKFPRPNQLSHKFNLPRILAAWEQHRGTRATYSHAPEYRSENYCALPEQLAHQQWVIDQLKLVGASDHRIGTAVYVDRVLLEDFARGVFGEERMSRVRDAVVVEQGTAAVGLNFQRSCFGLTAAFARTECEQCVHNRACGALATTLNAKLTSRLGVDDGHLANRRLKTRERVRRLREKRKTAATAA